MYGLGVEILQIATNGEVLARFGAALSDPTRARVLLALREAPAFPADLADLLGVSRQSLSNHLTCLRGCGLVVAIPEGRRVRYELADDRLRHALSDLLGVVLAVDEGYCQSADESAPSGSRLWPSSCPHSPHRAGPVTWTGGWCCTAESAGSWPRPSLTT